MNPQGAFVDTLASSRLEKGATPQITLPNQVEHVQHVAIDIGGSLAKIVYYEPDSLESATRSEDGEDVFLDASDVFTERQQILGGKLHFVKFETKNIDDCIEYISKHIVGKRQRPRPLVIQATGGGSHKFAQIFQDRLGVTLQREDEMECLVGGLNFLLRYIANEAFYYDRTLPEPRVFVSNGDDFYPYLLVNIGSGVSILKVEGDNQYTRVDGTSLGGGTFWGLCRLFTDLTSFDAMLEMSEKGDAKNVDMLVGDIYGGDYSSLGLSADTPASSFGRACMHKGSIQGKFRQEDIAAGLLRMVSSTIGQLAYHNAARHNLNRIYFGGYFIRGHHFTMEKISSAVNYFSKGKAKALFLRHEGYLGALGAFVNSERIESGVSPWWSWMSRRKNDLHSLISPVTFLVRSIFPPAYDSDDGSSAHGDRSDNESTRDGRMSDDLGTSSASSNIYSSANSYSSTYSSTYSSATSHHHRTGDDRHLHASRFSRPSMPHRASSEGYGGPAPFSFAPVDLSLGPLHCICGREFCEGMVCRNRADSGA
eukprot:TRINITY_DN3497_c1_g1_i2.p1 TRINITY_DN3497_c1_g1~~TRINITY_DN3497_c1_g1_i2.p1  ORF type:complete len:547 (-),score=108.07 TRINITY_DN3497_c1_g1_i2:40-1653(-)